MPAGPDLQLYRRLRYGSLLDIVMLDGRQYRSDQACGDNAQVRCAAALDPDRTMLGPEQERWLLGELDRSETAWRAIGQQTMMAQLSVRAGDPVYSMDQWDGYPAARNRIIQHLASRGIADTVVLSGDIHSAWVNDLRLDFDDRQSETVATELVCTSITANNPFAEVVSLAPLLNPHVRWVDGQHGYTLNTLTADRWTAEHRTLANVTSPEVDPSTATTWVVLAGRAGALQD
jgi:alkaline phosphatase D